MEDEKVEIDKDSVSKNIEGGELPDINKAIKDATGVSNWNISEDKESGNIIIEPGLVKFDGSKIIKVD